MNDLSLYFDYAAATPLNPKSLAAMQPYLQDNFYNPSAIYQAAIQVKKDIQAARDQVARELGAKPSEIIFTAGGTEANNLAINGIMSKYPKGKLLILAIEHDSVLKTANNYSHEIIKVNNKGIISLDDLENKITDDVVLISVMLANNEIGSIQPIKAVAEIINNIRQKRLKNNHKTPIYLHTDACQAVNYLDINTARLGVDLMTINSGKIYGPKQMGALFVKASVGNLHPIIIGGGQERGMRSGTENVAGIIGLANSLRLVRKKSKAEAARLNKLRDDFAKQLKQNLNDVVINGPSGHKRLPNNLNITIPGIDNERFLMELDEVGIKVATGSACSASSEEPSHVLKAIGLDNKDIFSSIRITFGKYTTTESCDMLLKNILRILGKSQA